MQTLKADNYIKVRRRFLAGGFGKGRLGRERYLKYLRALNEGGRKNE